MGDQPLKEFDGYVKVYVGRVRAKDQRGALLAVARRAERQLSWTANPGQQQVCAITDVDVEPIE